MIAMRWRSMKRSTGARNAKPSGSGSPGGLSTFSSAGSSVMLVEIRDQHAHAGDLAELGHAAIGGRQERQEAGGDRGGGERQRRAGVCARHARARARDRRPSIAVGAIAHAVLDAEVDAEADEQHRERDRDQVERPDHQEAERRRDGEPDDQIEEHRQDDPAGLQREPEDDQHDQRRSPMPLTTMPSCTVANSSSAIAHRSGQAHARAVVRRRA